MGMVREFVQQAASLEREAFLAQYPDAIMIRYQEVAGVDPREEYESTQKFRLDRSADRLRFVLLPPSPTDVVIPLRKADHGSFAGKILVGRTESNDLVVPHLSVSKHHAFFRIEPEGGRLVLTDTDSTNGTKLNGRALPAKEAQTLTDGDQIAFGDLVFVFYTAGGFYDLLRSLTALR